jgi:2',3'-cyclic-nucleotide 2'-phosphodiesterase (5'-nucleotidase family)
LQSKFTDAGFVLLDTGNFSDNPTPEGEAKTRLLIEGMGRLGYAASGVSERDLAMGYDEFTRQTAGAKFPFVSSNIVREDTKEPVFKPYVIVESKRSGGKPPVRIGVLGVVRLNPVFRKAGPDDTNLVILPPLDALKRYIETVRKNSDIVVLLGSIHKDDAREVVRALPGIDFVFGAYGGIYSSAEEAEGATRLFYTGNQGKRMGETRVYLGPDGRMVSQNSYLYFLTANYPDDPEMAAFVQKSLATLNQFKPAAKQGPERSAGGATGPPSR